MPEKKNSVIKSSKFSPKITINQHFLPDTSRKKFSWFLQLSSWNFCDPIYEISLIFLFFGKYRRNSWIFLVTKFLRKINFFQFSFGKNHLGYRENSKIFFLGDLSRFSCRSFFFFSVTSLIDSYTWLSVGFS